MDGELNAQNMYKCSPREVREFVIECIQAGLVPFIESSPGMGKSSIVKSIAREYDLHLIDERLSTRQPVDLSGMPDFQGSGFERYATFTPFDVYPLEGTPIPKGKNGWILFLDEFNSAAKSVQAAAYKLVLDRMVGLRHLHEATAIVAAGNLATDRAIVNNLSTAMQSRVIHIEMELNHQQWLDDVALVERYDERIIAYLSYKPSMLMDFRPDHNEKTFCCPRTWEFANRLVKGKEVTNKTTKLLAGTITSGVAADFVQFTRVYEHMPSYRDVLRDPENLAIPSDPPTRWALTGHLVEKVDKDTFEDIATYVNRMPSDFRILFFRSLLVRQPNLRTHPVFIRSMSQLSRYFHNEG